MKALNIQSFKVFLFSNKEASFHV